VLSAALAENSSPGTVHFRRAGSSYL
jgi:hypothetical protein